MCRVRQKQFIEAHNTKPMQDITNLDLILSLPRIKKPMSLRLAILGIKTRSNWAHSMFVSVDFDTYRGNIVVLFHLGNIREATMIVNFMYVFLRCLYD